MIMVELKTGFYTSNKCNLNCCENVKPLQLRIMLLPVNWCQICV
uniref:Uncharacterized protein n=1 Tax=Anguilla anguilla TaxID=7936 RepID=A0A0E9PR75_ANGAN